MKGRLYSWSENNNHRNIFSSQTRRQSYMFPNLRYEFENDARFINSNTLEIRVNDNTRSEILDANYAVIEQYIEREYCYYITDYEEITTGVYRLYLELDPWQTYANDMTVRGYLQQTNYMDIVPDPKYPYEPSKRDGAIFSGLKVINQDNTRFYCLAIYSTSDGFETVVFDMGNNTRDDAFQAAVLYAPMSNKIQYSQTIETRCICTKIYVLPEPFLNTNLLDTFHRLTMKSDNQYIADTNGWWYQHSKKEITFVRDLTYFREREYFGTIKNRIELPNIYKNYPVHVVAAIGFSTVDIYIECCDVVYDIEQDYEMPIVYSESLQNMEKNGTALALKTIGNIIGLGASIATANPISATMSLVGAAGDVSNYLFAKDKPTTISGAANAYTTLDRTYGTGIYYFHYRPGNMHEISELIKSFGYAYNSPYVSWYLHDVLAESQGSVYMRIKEVELWGRCPENARRQIKQTFETGVHIRYIA